MHTISQSIIMHTVTLPMILYGFYPLFWYCLQESAVETVESSVNKKFSGYSPTFVKMCSTQCLLVLLSISGCVELITVTTPQKNVNVTVGGSVLLQCMYVSSVETTTTLMFQWDHVRPSSMTAPQQVYYYQSGVNITGKSYMGRVQPPSSPGATKNVSIIISNMQPSDSGIYTCEVHNVPDVDGKSQSSIVVTVLEKPSIPYCAIHGDVESGHEVTLTCHSERGSPTPTYTWTRLDQSKTKRPVLGQVKTTGILEIRNISQFEFGEYECNATNVVGFSTCTIDLSHEVAGGMIAGAVIGALLGCVLILLVVWFIAHTMKKQKYKAVKISEANEMKRSSPQAATDTVPMATTASSVHAEQEEPQA
uniref:V-set and immunoglobulin domain-containing protein 1 n=1 Tax=Monopterus albus TaxID=43700 RepID=A0A3Q3JNQ2_MONAL